MDDNASRFVGSIPENYDTGLGPHIFEPYARDLASRIAALAPETVLELAAGTGIVSRRIRDALPVASRLTITDLNQPMLEVARAKFNADELVEFEAVDACRLPYADMGFDLVASQFGVMFFPDKAAHFAEVHRVLKPGGSYVFNVWGPWTDNPFAELTYEMTEALYPDDPPAFYKVPFGYHDVSEIERALSSGGFADVRVENVRCSSPIASVVNFSRGLIFGNPVSAEIVERGGDCEEIRQVLEQNLRDQLGGQLDLMALVTTATKP